MTDDAPVATAPVVDPVANHPAVVAAQAALDAAKVKATADLNALTATKVAASKATAYDKIVATVKAEAASVESEAARLIKKDEAKIVKWVKGHKVDTAIGVGVIGLAGAAAAFLL